MLYSVVERFIMGAVSSVAKTDIRLVLSTIEGQ